jgi:hypothetical protein
LYFVQFGCLWTYRDKKVVSVFVRFRAPLHLNAKPRDAGKRDRREEHSQVPHL